MIIKAPVAGPYFNQVLFISGQLVVYAGSIYTINTYFYANKEEKIKNVIINFLLNTFGIGLAL